MAMKIEQYELNNLFLEACDEEDLKEIKKLLQRGADINYRPYADQRYTIIHHLIHHIERNSINGVIHLLINWGADVNTRGENGATPLLDACTNPDLERIIALLNAGATINAVDNDGQNVLHYCCDINLHYDYILDETETYIVEEAEFFYELLEKQLSVILFFVSHGFNPFNSDVFTIYDVRDEDTPNYKLILPPLKRIWVTLDPDSKIISAWDIYNQRVREENWKKNKPFIMTLRRNHLLFNNKEIAMHAFFQSTMNTSVPIPGIPRKTKKQNLEYLNKAVLGNIFIVKLIASFIPRKRFELNYNKNFDDDDPS